MTQNYDSITSMEGLEHIRRRPGMYVGSVAQDGDNMPEALVQILQETLSNSIDEALVGYGDEISVTIHSDNSVTISDHGRGIPMGKDFDDVIRSFTVLNSSGKFDSKAYSHSGGLHGIGSKATAALSVYVDVNVVREDVAYSIKFAQKDIISKSHRKPKKGEQTGTSVTFLPDDSVFESIQWDSKKIARKIKAQSYMTPHVTYTFTDEREDNPETITYHHPNGIADLVENTAQGLNTVGSDKPLTFRDTAYFNGNTLVGLKDTTVDTKGLVPIDVDVSFLYTEDLGETIISYTNGIPNNMGGYHVDGTTKALYQVINQYAKDNKLLKAKDKLQPSDVRDGLVLAVSVSVPESIISFDGQTKNKLKTKQAEAATFAVMDKYFPLWMIDNSAKAKKIAQQVVDSMSVRHATADIRKATKATRKRNSKSDKLEMSSKLVKASPKAPANRRELFITEGDSAAGGVVSARKPEVINGKKVLTQGVLPIRGKIINPYGKRISRVLENKEVITIINVLGTGILQDFDISKLKYDKVIICTDADDDGFHIRTLLISLFWKLMPELIRQGHIYVANPPLFRFKTYVKGKPKTAFALDMDEYHSMKKKHKGWDVTRLKGLGEMDPVDLGVTTVRRDDGSGGPHRKLTQITVEDAEEAQETIAMWMLDDAQARRDFLEKHAHLFQEADEEEKQQIG